MKKKYLNTLLVQLSIFLLLGCSKNEILMEENVKVDSLFMDGSKVFPKWDINVEFVVKNSGTDTIYGYYTNGQVSTYFYTTNGFKTFKTNSLPVGWKVAYYNKDKIIIQHYIYSIGECESMESSDFGLSFKSKIKFHLDSWYSVYSPVFLNYNEGLFFIRSGFQGEFNTDYITVYKITNNLYQKVTDINIKVPYGLTPRIPCYIDNNNIFFIAYGKDADKQRQSYICHSADGGMTWQIKTIESLPIFGYSYSNSFIDNKNVITINKDKYVFFITQFDFYATNSTERFISIYYTYDKGVNWVKKEFNINGKIMSVQFVDNNTGYMLVKTNNSANAKVYKSNDSGETWNIIGPEIYADVITFDANGNGIAIAIKEKIVQSTHDGGLTWDLITYTFNDFR